MAKLKKLTDFLDRLDSADLHYTLTSIREGAVMVGITVPSERWEIEFLADGEVEIEVFESNGEIYDEQMITQLFSKHGQN